MENTPERPDTAGPRAPRSLPRLSVADVVLPAVLLLVGLPLAAMDGTAFLSGAVFHTLFCLLLLARRKLPFATLLAVLALAALQWALGVTVLGEFGIFTALYHVLVRRPWPYCTAGLVLVAAAVGLAGSWLPEVTIWGRTAVLITLTYLLVATTILALVVRGRQERIWALERETRLLRFQKDQQAQLAAVNERNRIAREVHDIVGHSLGVMVSLSDAAVMTTHSSPDQAVSAMEKVAETGRSSLAEVRHVLGLLREGGADSPSHGDVHRLVADAVSAGILVRLDQRGDLDGLPASLRMCVYRVVQESLTNARRHAGDGADTSVEVAVTPQDVQVTITDSGGDRSARRPHDPPASGGTGLLGLRERVLLHHGELTAGPLDSGGWRLHARLPRPDGSPAR